MAYPLVKLNGQQVTPPVDWQSLQVLLTWDNESVQANISTSDLTFVGDGARLILDWINGGLDGSAPGFFQGIPITIDVVEGNASIRVFNGHTNQRDAFTDMTPNDTNLPFKVQTQLRQDDQIISFKQRAAGTSFDLVNIVYPLSNDAQWLLYVLQAPYDPFQTLMIAVTICIETIQLAQMVRNIAADTADATALTATAGFGSLIAGPAYGIAIAIIEAIYIAVQLTAMIILINQLLGIYLPMPKKVQVISLRKLAQRACQYLGLNFHSSISQLDEWYILPSKNKIMLNQALANTPLDGIQANAYFNCQDYGYMAGDFFKQIEQIFRGKFQIIGNDIYFESLTNDAFWISTANYQMPNVFKMKRQFNASDMAGDRLISFSQDTFDAWTYQNYTGTVYEVQTTHINPAPSANITTTDTLQNLISGLDQVQIKWALGTEKKDLNLIEQFFSSVVSVLEDLAGLFGQNIGGLIAAYANIKQALKLSQDQTQVPKLLACQTGAFSGGSFLVLKNNHRSELCAKAIWNNWLYDKSFVSANYRNQWQLFTDIKIPFGFSDYNLLRQNNYFIAPTGEVCRMDSIKWEINSDFALASYRVRKPYDKNLQEIFYESNG